jgi:hypothetical protein
MVPSSRVLRPSAFLRMRGWRAEKRKPVVSASIAGRGGRLSARHLLDESGGPTLISRCEMACAEGFVADAHFS